MAQCFAGMQLRGRVLATFVRGSQVFGEAVGVVALAFGRAIRAAARWRCGWLYAHSNASMPLHLMSNRV